MEVLDRTFRERSPLAIFVVAVLVLAGIGWVA